VSGFASYYDVQPCSGSQQWNQPIID
jgi:hypothetical protein